MKPELVIVPAGAGAGKTHRIKTQLIDWIKSGTVRPERVMAVTFTEAAAAELRERVRAGLLADGLITEAMAIERAYISTIHGLGLRLLTEHALAAGTALKPRLLADAERNMLVRQALARATKLSPIQADPERFGYRNNPQTGQTIEDALRGRVLSMIDLLRGLGDKGRDPDLIAPALLRFDDIYGEKHAQPNIINTDLLHAVQKMLTAFPEGGMATVTARGPRADLEKQHTMFQRIQQHPGLLKKDWKLWQSMRKLFISNNRTKTPEGYDEYADRIIQAANALTMHPGPLEDAKLHFSCLVASAQEVMEIYEARKKSLGLIDYPDMIATSERLLRTKPEIRQAVLDEIDCVIIDEFQDTNPVQFALLWHLGARTPRVLLVGDAKQSIMGFQGADSRLSQALAVANPDSLQPLQQNWRSTPDVMRFVNAMGAGLFDTNYNTLKPTRESTNGPGLEILNMTKGRRVKKFSGPQEHVAERIAGLLNAGEMITDRDTRIARSVRPSDIALLVCRHTTATRYANELRSRGVPVRITESGWMQRPVIQVLRAALNYAANPADIHSGILLRTAGPNPVNIQDALAAQINGTSGDDSVLTKLAELSAQCAYLPITTAINVILDATGLRDWIYGLPDAKAAHADLLRFESEAHEFEIAHRDLRAASGFHGETLKVFMGWLDAHARDPDFDYRPEPSGNSAEAVEIITWHASKGREWPITVVAELDNGIKEHPGNTAIQFNALDKINDMEAVLASAMLVHTPEFTAPEVTSEFIEARRATFENNAKNLLYVALTRARDRLILEWPGFLKDRNNAEPASNLFDVFMDCCMPEINRDALRINGVECPAIIETMPDQAGFTEYESEIQSGMALFGNETSIQPDLKIPALPQLNPIESPSETIRKYGLNLAMQTLLTKPELIKNLKSATGLNKADMILVEQRVNQLKTSLSKQGYTEWAQGLPVWRRHAQDEKTDLIVLGNNRKKCMLVDCKFDDHDSESRMARFSEDVEQVNRVYKNCEVDGLVTFQFNDGHIEYEVPSEKEPETSDSPAFD